jgi:hypothetical protein
LVSVVAIASPLRVQEEPLVAGTITLSHLASPAKPVNGFYAIQDPIMETISDLRRSSARHKIARNTVAATNRREFHGCSCIVATLGARLKMNLTFERGHRL